MFVGGSPGHPRIAVAQHLQLGQPQGPHGAGQLDPAYGAQGFPGGGAFLPYLPFLPGSRGDQADRHAPLGMGGQRAAHGESLIVGMSEKRQQTKPGHTTSSISHWD